MKFALNTGHFAKMTAPDRPHGRALLAPPRSGAAIYANRVIDAGDAA